MPTITGTANADSLLGTGQGDFIYGLAGDDFINGLGGDDFIDGGSGQDIVFGGDGDDRIIDIGSGAGPPSEFDGGAGFDTLDYSSWALQRRPDIQR